jgi:hypothetical protein
LAGWLFDVGMMTLLALIYCGLHRYLHTGTRLDPLGNKNGMALDASIAPSVTTTCSVLLMMNKYPKIRVKSPLRRYFASISQLARKEAFSCFRGGLQISSLQLRREIPSEKNVCDQREFIRGHACI